jgi:hypothetical protein
MLRHAQRRHTSLHDDAPLWIVWLDSDELLLWGEYLIDWLHRTEHETGAGGFIIRLVELDGSVVMCHGRVVRGDLIRSYEHSIATILLKNGMLVSLPNVPVCAAGGVPYWTDESRAIEVDDLARLRPPLAGEPHLLHRSLLRDPSRDVERQSVAESRWFDEHDPQRQSPPTTDVAGVARNDDTPATLRPLGNVDIIPNDRREV